MTNNTIKELQAECKAKYDAYVEDAKRWLVWADDLGKLDLRGGKLSSDVYDMHVVFDKSSARLRQYDTVEKMQKAINEAADYVPAQRIAKGQVTNLHLCDVDGCVSVELNANDYDDYEIPSGQAVPNIRSQVVIKYECVSYSYRVIDWHYDCNETED